MYKLTSISALLLITKACVFCVNMDYHDECNSYPLTNVVSAMFCGVYTL